MAKIEKVIKGQAPSLLDADKANELIEKINGLMASQGRDPLKLVVDSDGKINVSFDASPLRGIIVVNGEATQKIVFVQNPPSED